jgi:hypothetical protein
MEIKEMQFLRRKVKEVEGRMRVSLAFKVYSLACTPLGVKHL